jgi:hypothetical protein
MDICETLKGKQCKALSSKLPKHMDVISWHSQQVLDHEVMEREWSVLNTK